MKLWSILLSSVFFFFITKTAFAAACCGGGFAAPSIIAGDDKAQLTTSYSFSEVVVDNVDSQGIWRKSAPHQEVQTFLFEGAHIFHDRWQAGFALPVLQRSYLDQHYSGFGDITGTIGYEYLPDWSYHPFRPKGIGFFQVILPTGKSRAESEVGGLDSRGNGFWSVGAGTLLTKIFGSYDVFSSLEVHRAFKKRFSNSRMSGRLEPGFGGNLRLGGGYNLRSFRFGASIAWSYEDPVRISGTVDSSGSMERFATAAASASYLVSNEWAGTFSYSDQTLFGSPVNTSLGRTITLQIQRRWSR